MLDVFLVRPEHAGAIEGESFSVKILWRGCTGHFQVTSPEVSISELDPPMTLRGPAAAVVLLLEVEAQVNLLLADLAIEIGSPNDWLIDAMLAPLQRNWWPWRSLAGWWTRHRRTHP